MPNAPDARITDAWNSHRAFLLDVAYRLLGSYSEAEDIVQEAFTRLLRSDLDPIEDVRAWLVVVVSRLCLDHLRSARVKREAYIGPWFPEPIVDGDLGTDPAAIVTMDESVRMALLIVLERMSPAERVVFVLHDVFEFDFEKIATMVNRTPAACRQLASRARRRVKEEAGASRFIVDPKEQARVVEAFVAACSSGDVEQLLPLLDASVMGWADIGGILPTVSQPNVGPEKVAGSLMRFFGPGAGVRLVARWVNGEPGVIALGQDAVRAVLALSTKDRLITRVYAVADPRKLTRVPADLIARARSNWEVADRPARGLSLGAEAGTVVVHRGGRMAETKTAIANKPVWVDLSSQDPAGSRDFYAKLFGWKIEVNPDPQYGGYAMAQVGGKNAAGIGPKMQPQQPTAWSLYIGSDDADASAKIVEAAGGKVLAPPFDVGPQGRMAAFQDPVGAVISIWQPKAMAGDFPWGQPNTFGWAELDGRGLDKALPFYQKLFGWSIKQSPMGEGMPPYTEFQVDGNSVAGAMDMGSNAPPQMPNFWLVYFSVDDVDKATKKATAAGAKEMMGPQDFPGGRFSVVTDPQGATFGLLKMKPAQP